MKCRARMQAQQQAQQRHLQTAVRTQESTPPQHTLIGLGHHPGHVAGSGSGYTRSQSICGATVCDRHTAVHRFLVSQGLRFPSSVCELLQTLPSPCLSTLVPPINVMKTTARFRLDGQTRQHLHVHSLLQSSIPYLHFPSAPRVPFHAS
jgi:hypothetical protein